MTAQEFKRLLAYSNAAKLQREHSSTIVGKRIAKGRASGYGAILRESFIKPTVHIGTIFRTESTAYRYSTQH